MVGLRLRLGLRLRFPHHLVGTPMLGARCAMIGDLGRFLQLDAGKLLQLVELQSCSPDAHVVGFAVSRLFLMPMLAPTTQSCLVLREGRVLGSRSG